MLPLQSCISSAGKGPGYFSRAKARVRNSGISTFCLRDVENALVAVLAACIAVSMSSVAWAGDPVKGERVFQRCYSCHSVDPNERAKLQGPSLYRVIGRAAGSLAGFEYSDGMKAKAGLVWDAASIAALVADAEAFVPGTRMAMPPLRDADEVADLIAYLAASGAR